MARVCRERTQHLSASAIAAAMGKADMATLLRTIAQTSAQPAPSRAAAS
ncbi:hypothetical protein FMEAI12_3500009 [Parafrankia sp. Ea1.12]|nr:hypothetical protein [Parafrankia sp. Ea1.12]SQD96156.1 hypothetical protein FMEAI12_3500009 [Parafrankia sp. Ea1.12]